MTPIDIISRSQLAPLTKDAYTSSIERFMGFAGHDPAKWTPMQVEAWRDHLLGEGLKPQTANRHLYALRYLGRRIEALAIGYDFARAAESSKVAGRKRRVALNVDEVSSVIDTTAADRPPDVRDRALVTLGVRAGLRVSEMVNLAWPMLQENAITFTIKGGRTHRIVLDTESLAALHDWGEVSGRKGRVFRSMRSKLDGTYAMGPGLTRQGVHKILSGRAEDAGLSRHIHPHLLRHTFITWALRAGVPPQRVMLITGHLNLQTLSGYVSDLDAETNPVGNSLPPLRRS